MIGQLNIMRLEQIMDTSMEEQWLIDQLWSQEAVGIIGGEPKTCKSWLALDMALSVATGAKCLGKFFAPTQHPVLYLAGEDKLVALKVRLAKIAAARNVETTDIPLYLVDGSGVDLTNGTHREAVIDAAKDHNVGLVIIDPLVRFHRSSENSSSSMSNLLDGIRKIQKEAKTAVAVVHHFKKGRTSTRGGQALRGSSELHAWGESNLYLSRGASETIQMETEHRNASSGETLCLNLAEEDLSAALRIIEEKIEELPLEFRILHYLKQHHQPASGSKIARDIHARKAEVLSTLREMYAEQKVCKTESGYTANPVYSVDSGGSQCPWGIS